MQYNLTIGHIQRFITVVDSGSFERAAKQLCLNPSSVIRNINQLEADLQTTLLIRSPQGVVPTQQGKQFYSGAKGLLDELDRIICLLMGETIPERKVWQQRCIDALSRMDPRQRSAIINMIECLVQE